MMRTRAIAEVVNNTREAREEEKARMNSSDGDGRSVLVLDDRWYENLSKLKPCIKDEGIMDYSSIIK